MKRRTWTLGENATYLIAGGLGGIGRAILKWLVTRGVKYILVPSRSGATSQAAIEIVDELTRQGITITTPICDLSSTDSLSRMLEKYSVIMPPIRGCIVATMDLNASK
jgi:NAD(P)-dependent dehydrogenase (short-subunit alcohol dehydrogenase family)